jgi:hypothetical protein
MIKMALKIKKIVRDIKAGRFGQSVQRVITDYTDAANAGHRRQCRAPMCIR